MGFEAARRGDPERAPGWAADPAAGTLRAEGGLNFREARLAEDGVASDFT